MFSIISDPSIESDVVTIDRIAQLLISVYSMFSGVRSAIRTRLTLNMMSRTVTVFRLLGSLSTMIAAYSKT